MDACEVVVSTCAFGGGDDLYQPIGMTEASLRKVIIYKSKYHLLGMKLASLTLVCILRL